MKFGRLIEYNTRKIFILKSYTGYSVETSPRPFFWKIKFSIFLDQKSKVLNSLFLLHAKLRAIEIYWNYAADRLLLPRIKQF